MADMIRNFEMKMCYPKVGKAALIRTRSKATVQP